jgi:hypothetical protein
MTILKGFSSLGDAMITTHTRENLISLFDYGLLEKSAYTNIDIPTTGVYGGLEHKLRPVDDPRFSRGQVWEGFRSNWVWESGVGAYTSTNPAYPGVSGVYVTGVFYPTSTTGIYAHHINHTLGRVVFNNPIATSLDISCRYSYKYVNVCQADGLNWFRRIQEQSERADNPNYISNSGESFILPENRIQLPMIGVEVINSRRMSPFAIGGGQYVKTDFLMHCVAEDSYTRDMLADVVSMQNDKVFTSYDLDLISSSNAFPLDYRGVPISGAKTYPDLVSNYPGKQIRIIDSKFDSMYSMTPKVHVGSVKITTETILFGV